MLYAVDQVTIKGAVSAEEYADELFKKALEIEKEYAELLATVYGETPIWYTNFRE